MNKSHLIGIGTAVPPNRISQSRIAEMLATFSHREDSVQNLQKRFHDKSEIGTRCSVLSDSDENNPISFQSFYKDVPGTDTRMRMYENTSVDIALRSAEDAVHESGLQPDQLQAIITVSCTGFFAPGLDSVLIHRLGLNRDIRRLHVGFMGCHGMFNAIQTAGSMVESGRVNHVLIVSVELCTLHFQKTRRTDQLLANALFADGSSSVVVSSENKGPSVTISDSVILENSQDHMSWKIGSEGFRMTLSKRIPELIKASVPDWLERRLGNIGLRQKDIRTWAVHPGGPKILSGTREALQLSEDDLKYSKSVLHNYGNMSSATLGFMLKAVIEDNAPGPVAALGFGPGIAAELLVIL